jgi:hypothetical protein
VSLYDVSAHPLLGGKALTLDADALEEQASLAEDLLSLAGTTFEGDDAKAAARAVAIQVSYQVERGIEGSVYQTLTRGSRTFNFRDSGYLAPEAVEIVATLLGLAGEATPSAWPAITSYRG